MRYGIFGTKASVEDLTAQNTLLHSQFEQLTASRTQVSDLEENQEGPVSTKTVTDLTEVIKYLRREKEIVETKLQLALSESERSKLQLDHVQKSLDESRAVLEEVFID